MIYMWNNMVNKTKNKVKIFMQNKNNRTIATIALIIVCFFAFNLSGLLNNVFTSLANLFTNVDGEIKELVIESEGYDTEGGSYKITKRGNWSSSTEVELEYELESIAEDNGVNKDVVLVLDISKSMEGTRIDELKSSTSDLVKTLLSKNDNKVGIVSFSTSAKVESNLTNDETVLLNAIEGLTPNGDTSYYQALLKLEELLKEYQEVDNRELIVIFITDGYPNIDTPNEKAQYKLLKNKYPKMKIHGIRNEIHSSLAALSYISDYQYSTSQDLSLLDILKKIALSTEYYKNYKVIESIDNEYFNVKKDDIKVSVGEVEVIKEDNQQKIIWTADDGEVKSGSKQKMAIKLTVVDDKKEQEGLYNISTLTEADLILTSGESHRLSSNESLKFKSGYKVKYEANAPAGCNASINLEETHYAYENVKFTNQKLECDGYQFGGWEVAEEVVSVNDDVFQMPTYNVTVKGIWKQLSLDKTMDGEVYEKLTLYKTIARQAVPDNIKSEYVTSVTGINFKNNPSNSNGKGVYTVSSTLNKQYPVHYFRGDIDNNNVLFGEHCWKIVRTTETGGVKIIYNGVPTNGKCLNTTGTSTQIGKSYFNSNEKSLSDIGYMYNIQNYDVKLMSDPDYIRIMNGDYFAPSSNYYYGTGISYNSSTGLYTLVNARQYSYESNYENLVGLYTCRTSSGTSCSSVSYITDTSSNAMFYFLISNGDTLNNANYTINFGRSYTKNSNGTYTLNNLYTFKLSEWTSEYLDNRSGTDYYKDDYYVCADPKSTTCTTLYHLFSTNSHGYHYISSDDNIVYGNSFEYVDGKYVLKDTVEFWDLYESYEDLNNHHYTCFNKTGTCTTLYYIYGAKLWTIITDVNDRFPLDPNYYYVTLTDGDGISDILNEMFNDEEINKVSSEIKTVIDDWYGKNITNYTKYLEDTVWCNDRSISNLGGFDADGGTVIGNVLNGEKLAPLFDTYIRQNSGNLSLECRTVDSFTTSIATGNGKLTYPVGLITADEVKYAGLGSNSYLYTGETYWTMSPYYLYFESVNLYNGNSSSAQAKTSYGVRPMISLKPNTEYTTGDGTPDNPYVIKLEQ